MDAEGLVALELPHGLLDGVETSRCVGVGGRVAREVIHRPDGRLDLYAMLLGGALRDVAPLAPPAAGRDLFLAEVRPDQDGVVPHSHRELVVARAAGAERLAHLLVDEPLEVRDPVRLLPPQDAHDPLGGREFMHAGGQAPSKVRPALTGVARDLSRTCP